MNKLSHSEKEWILRWMGCEEAQYRKDPHLKNSDKDKRELAKEEAEVINDLDLDTVDSYDDPLLFYRRYVKGEK
ncbi:hypothetical protein [Acetilactobacillus jinshanensis]|uniref:Uncharacterized protein n=1 Tax=Acetilactobacillus jinshanensis TaxID=1720083 RepID=A0A4P6ZM73_9LACO|nr:hypothetical protein [Acetilactobacillus jinshanensis]QBP18522.1 hypothetical protein ELX58_05120 [Acetilactobacillus jinshanensis]URL61395.1 hypothetical protein HGK75_05245 [uncultured bacterium]